MVLAWFKLIAHQQRQHKLSLTFPFILRALRNPVGQAFASEDAALDAMRDLAGRLEVEVPDSHFVTISKCPTLGEPTVTVASMYYHESYAMWGIPKPSHTQKLRVASPYLRLGETGLECVIHRLWDPTRTPLMSACFSFRQGGYLKHKSTPARHR
jgi:hypothetical protein